MRDGEGWTARVDHLGRVAALFFHFPEAATDDGGGALDGFGALRDFRDDARSPRKAVRARAAARVGVLRVSGGAGVGAARMRAIDVSQSAGRRSM